MHNSNSSAFREDFLKDREKISDHELSSHHNYFGINEVQYILSQEDASAFMKKLEKKYYILKIEKQQKFSYDNVYMDTKGLHLYKHQGSKKENFIVRTRKYSRHEKVYFQVKHISNKRTNVYSHEYVESTANKLTNEMRSFYGGIHQAISGHEPHDFIFPVVEVYYDRYIFYNKKTDERIDIDFNIRFTDLRNPKHPTYALGDIVLIESKTSHASSTAEKTLKDMGAKKKKVSLYALALHYIGIPSDNKELHKTVKKIRKLQKKKR